MPGQVMEKTYTDKQHRVADALGVPVERLFEQLRSMKGETETIDAFADRLTTQTGVYVSHGTVHNWIRV